MTDDGRSRRIRLEGSLDLGLTVGPLRRGAGEPTTRVRDSLAWRATRTPVGPATERIERVPDGALVTAWGPGAEWLLEAAPDLLGLDDDPAAFRPTQPLLRQLAVRLAGLRIGRSSAVLEALVPAILEQKVTGEQARRGFRGLVRSHGEPAPGPVPPDGRPLWLPPPPHVLARLPYHAYHPFGIERRRAETIRRVASVAGRLEAVVELPLDAAYPRLRAIPGIGQWTAAEVGQRALGDPDAVSVGDFHLPNLVAWALAGEPRGTDERMLELLEPYHGQRGRVIRLLEASGIRAPAYGPRLAPRRIEAD
jgi:3-methyladenine DNA glycosylase/8-oxoguanine DNA glycosylase